MTSLFRLHLSLKPQKSLCLSRWLVSTPYHYTVHGIPLSCRAISDLCLLSCSVVLSLLLFLLRLLISICIYFLCMHKISLRSSQPAPYIIQIMIQFLTLVQILEYTINMQVCCEFFFLSLVDLSLFVFVLCCRLLCWHRHLMSASHRKLSGGARAVWRFSMKGTHLLINNILLMRWVIKHTWFWNVFWGIGREDSLYK